MKIPSLVAALAILSLAGAPAFAQDKAPPPTKDQLAKGDKDAPAVIAAAGVTCTPTAAAFRGAGKTAKSTVDIYEVACQQGLGYLLLKTSDGTAPQAVDCLAAMRGGTKCVLPGNADPKAGLAAPIAAAGRTCAVSAAEYLGSSAAAHKSFYEVACGSAAGFRLGLPTSGGDKPEVTDCLALLGTDGACKLTTREMALASLTPLIQASGRPCAVSNARYVGSSPETGGAYYEVACGAAGGFMLVADASTMKYRQVVDCAKAEGIAGGCKLTDASVSQKAQLATYTQTAAKAGFPCEVNKFRLIGQDSRGREVVELACANRPDGAVAAFSDKGASNVYDCVRAGGLGQACQLSSPSAVYARYTAALVAKGRSTCKVSNAIWLGATNSGSDYIETACADGKPGWVMSVTSGTMTIGELLSCRQATASGLACKLPTNVAGNKGT